MLDEANRCRLFRLPERPAVYARLRPESAMCGKDRAQALALLEALERSTAA